MVEGRGVSRSGWMRTVRVLIFKAQFEIIYTIVFQNLTRLKNGVLDYSVDRRSLSVVVWFEYT